MVVETAPASPEDEARYHETYDEHIEQLLRIEGVTAARRYRVLDDSGTYVAMYELEGDDLLAVRARIGQASKEGETRPPEGMRLDPPPRVQIIELLE
jgi:hypothetical protein